MTVYTLDACLRNYNHVQSSLYIHIYIYIGIVLLNIVITCATRPVNVICTHCVVVTRVLPLPRTCAACNICETRTDDTARDADIWPNATCSYRVNYNILSRRHDRREYWDLHTCIATVVVTIRLRTVDGRIQSRGPMCACVERGRQAILYVSRISLFL